MSRRARLVAAAGALAVMAGAGAMALPEGGTPVGGARDGPIGGFSIAYRVETFVSPGAAVSSRTVAVRRPFDGRDVVVGGSGEDAASGFVADGGHLYAVRGDEAVDLGERPPGVAPGDYRLDAVLPDLERLGLADRRGTREVAGRSCRLYRLGAPLGDAFRPPTSAEHADVCVDGDGLVLSEEWSLDGRVVRRTWATDVELGTPEKSAVGVGAREVVANRLGTSRVDELPVDRIPDVHAPYWHAARPADGFRQTHRTRAMLLAPPGGALAPPSLVYADTYRRGGDIVSVEHRERPSGASEPIAGHEQREVARLGAGAVVLTEFGAELHFAVEGWQLVVKGTLGTDDLVAFAERLRPRGT